MKTSVETQTKLLEEFLAQNGLSAHFLVRIKPKHPNIEEYVKWLNNAKFNIRSAFFLAFWWNPKEEVPWKIHSQNWKTFLNKRKIPDGCGKII